MTQQYFEDFEIGDETASSIARTISESEVYLEAGLSGNYNPLHVNKEYMKNTDFGRRIVQNTLLITIMNGLAREAEWDPKAIAAYGRDNMRFLKPVFIGDTVRLELEIVDKRPRDENSGIVTFQEQLFNQKDELTVTGEYLMLLERK